VNGDAETSESSSPDGLQDITPTPGLFDGDGNGTPLPDMGAYEYATLQVTASAGAHGTLDASTPSPQTTSAQATVSFTFNADSNYHVTSVSGCGGTAYSNSSNAVASWGGWDQAGSGG
jgi:hypothetical protein